MEYMVVIPAAGVGKRMGVGKNKLLIDVKEVPIIVYTINVFENDDWCKGIVLVINENDRSEMEWLIKRYQFKKIQAITTGGLERQYSVFEGLKCMNWDSIVLIHDGARPFVKVKHIHQLVNAVSIYGAAIIAVPVTDTIKKVNDHVVLETVDRTNLWAVQTPQGFQFSLIKEAHERAIQENFVGTDDASLVERMGKDVFIVKGDFDNIKITTVEDLYFAQTILQHKRL